MQLGYAKLDSFARSNPCVPVFPRLPSTVVRRLGWQWTLCLTLLISAAPLLSWNTDRTFSAEELVSPFPMAVGEEELGERDVLSPCRTTTFAASSLKILHGLVAAHGSLPCDDRIKEVPSPPPWG